MEKSGERNVGTVTGPRGPQPATSYRFSHYNVITTPQVLSVASGKKRLFVLLCALIRIKVAASSLFLFLLFFCRILQFK